MTFVTISEPFLLCLKPPSALSCTLFILFAIWDKNDFPLSHAALYMLSTLVQKAMLCDFPHLFPLEIKHKKQTPFSFFEASSLTLKLHGSSYTSVDLYIIGTH